MRVAGAKMVEGFPDFSIFLIICILVTFRFDNHFLNKNPRVVIWHNTGMLIGLLLCTLFVYSVFLIELLIEFDALIDLF